MISHRLQLVCEMKDVGSCKAADFPVVIICVWARTLVCALVGVLVCVCNVLVLITCDLAFNKH
jgi:hypothetical protein